MSSKWYSAILRGTLALCFCWCSLQSGTCTETSRLQGTAFIDYEKVVQTHVKSQELYKARNELAITQKTVDHLNLICPGCVWPGGDTHSETLTSSKARHSEKFRSWQHQELKNQVKKLRQLEAKTNLLQVAIARDIESAARASARHQNLVLVLKNVYYSDGMPDLTKDCIVSLSAATEH